MKRKLRTLMIVLLAAVFLTSGGQMLRQYLAYTQAGSSQQAALAAAQRETLPAEELPEEPVPLAPLPEIRPLPQPKQPEPENFPGPGTAEEPLDETTAFLLELDLEALRAVNPDVLGWICIPDTVISYPLMKAVDNQEYLYQTWDGKQSKFGSIFLECRNSHDLSDFNTLVYGHNMLTEDMFGTLLDFGQQSHYEGHPSVYIRTDGGVRRYDIFSAYEAKVVSDTYRLIFEDDARRQTALDLYTASSVLDTGLTPTVEDHILTLSTCTGRGTPDLRFVVQALLAEETPVQ